jgi:hypothetical protein
MSEYKYYEWRALDRPLTPEEQSEVRRLSSHIEVNATGACVEYNWGDFKHDPLAVLARFFDAFMYYANWGCQRLAFRFPAGLVEEDALQPFLWPYCVDTSRSGDHLLLDITYPADGAGEWFEMGGDLSGLARLRDDILQGDYRALYLAWLMAAEMSDASDEDLSPPTPAGLAQLSAAHAEFIAYFGIDRWLVEAAAEASSPLRPPTDIPLDQAISRLGQFERDDFLLRLARGEPHLSLALNRRLQEMLGVREQAPAAGRPTWGELYQRADTLRAQANQRAREESERQRIRDLEAFALRADQAWHDIDILLVEKKARTYDEAVGLLCKLRDLAEHQGKVPPFQVRVDAVAERYASRPAFVERLRKAGLA